MKYIISTLLGLSLLGGTAFAANSAKPGDALFGLKKAEENIAVNLAFSEQAKAELQAKFAARRLEELNQIQAQARAEANVQAQAEINAHGASDKNQPTSIQASAKTETKAEAEAKTEVSNAVKTLTDVQAKLQAKGNANAAASLEETLLKLKAKATEGANVKENSSGNVEIKAGSDVVQPENKTDSQINVNANQSSQTGIKDNSGTNANLNGGATGQVKLENNADTVQSGIDASGGLNSVIKIK